MDRRAFLGATTIPMGSATPIPLIEWPWEDNEDQAIDKVEEVMDEFLEPLRNSSDESVETADEIGSTLCNEYGELKDVSNQTLDIVRNTDQGSEIPSEIRHYLSLLEGIIELFNDEFTTNLDTSLISKMDEIANVAATLVPILLSAKKAVESGCDLSSLSESASQEKREEMTRTFLISCGVLIAEIIVIEFSVTYRVSFLITRKIANRLLIHLRGLVGLKAYAILLKEVHWTVRGELAETFTYILRKTTDLDDELPIHFAVAFDDDDIKQLEEAKDSLENDWEELENIADNDIFNDGGWWERLLSDDGDIFPGGVDLPI